MTDFQCFDRSTTSGFYTDMHWRCEVTEEVNWFQAEFDDSSWSNAFLSPNHSTYNSAYLRENIGLNSKMIWYYNDTHDGPVYCRGRVYYRTYKIISCTVKDCIFHPATCIRVLFYQSQIW